MRVRPNSNNFPYLYRGIVLENKDTMHLGRCKIKIPSIHGSGVGLTPDMLPWARVMTSNPYNLQKGSYSIPDIGDIVWVLFEGGDIDSPVYLGGTVGTSDEPVNPENVLIYMEGSVSISYNRNSKEILLKNSGNEITIKEDGIELVGNVKINGKEVNPVEYHE